MPYMKFLSVRSDICRQLPSDSTSRWTPLPLTMQFPLLGLARDFHPLDNAHAERTTTKSLDLKVKTLATIKVEKTVLIKRLILGLHHVALCLEEIVFSLIKLSNAGLTILVFSLSKPEGILIACHSLSAAHIARLGSYGIVVQLLNLLKNRLVRVLLP